MKCSKCGKSMKFMSMMVPMNDDDTLYRCENSECKGETNG